MHEQSELIKEVFARFGTAYYESEVLHRGLCNVYASATFDDPKSVTRPRLQEKLSYAYSLTLGQIIKESKHLFPTHIQVQLTKHYLNAIIWRIVFGLRKLLHV